MVRRCDFCRRLAGGPPTHRPAELVLPPFSVAVVYRVLVLMCSSSRVIRYFSESVFFFFFVECSVRLPSLFVSARRGQDVVSLLVLHLLLFASQGDHVRRHARVWGNVTSVL